MIEYMIYMAKLIGCVGLALGNIMALAAEWDNRKHEKVVRLLLSSIAWSLIVIWLQQM